MEIFVGEQLSRNRLLNFKPSQVLAGAALLAGWVEPLLDDGVGAAVSGLELRFDGAGDAFAPFDAIVSAGFSGAAGLCWALGAVLEPHATVETSAMSSATGGANVFTVVDG